ncbi:hypothetical protein ACHQM5_002967 [Ranunculus cassubicifolius]
MFFQFEKFFVINKGQATVTHHFISLKLLFDRRYHGRQQAIRSQIKLKSNRNSINSILLRFNRQIRPIVSPNKDCIETQTSLWSC